MILSRVTGSVVSTVKNERLRGRLAQAEAIMEAQKKLSELLGLSPRETGNDE